MKNDVLARRYARALYELAREEGLEEKIQTDLRNIVALIRESDEFRTVMVSPLYDINLKKRILGGVLTGIALSNYVNNFLHILLEKDRFAFIDDILNAYKTILDEASGLVKAYVTSATDLTSDQQQKIRNVFSALISKKVDLELTVDPSLIGGLVVEIQGMVYDGSIMTQLSKIKQSLKGEM